MREKHRLAYRAISDVSQERHGAVTILTKHIGVTRESYYKHQGHGLTIWEQKDQLLKSRVLYHFNQNFKGIGAGSLLMCIQHDEMIDFTVTLKQIKRVQKALGIRCNVRIKRYNRAKQREENLKKNILNREFDAESPFEKWCADSTECFYGTTRLHKVRFSAVLDLYGRRIIAYNITPTETAEAEIELFRRAFAFAGKVQPLIHTDCGSAYTSHAFGEYMNTMKCERSMSNPGTPYDNAPIEHWWNEFKLRWLASHPRPETINDLKTLIEEGIKYFNHSNRTVGRNGMTADKMWNLVA